MTFRRKSTEEARTMMRATSVVAKERTTKVISNQSLVAKIPKVPQVGHICIIRSLGGIGDVLMITPGIRALKEQNPELEITVAVDMHSTWDCSYREILKNAPFIDHLIDARFVNRNKYTKVIDISSVCIPFEKKDFKVSNRIDLFARALGVRELVNKLPFYKVEAHEREATSKFLKSKDCFGKTIIGFNPASNDSKRSWSRSQVVRFVELLSKQKNQAKLILFDFANSYPDLTKLDFVIDGSKTTVREMAALIERCHVFVTPDTGPMHLAGALGVTSICLFGSIPPESRINYYPSHVAITSENLSCLGCWYSPCQIDTQCMKDISAERVYQLVLEKMRFDNEVIFNSVLNPVDGYGSSAEQLVKHLSYKTSVSWDGQVRNTNWKQDTNLEAANRLWKGSGKHLISYTIPNMSPTPNSLTNSFYTMWESTKPPILWKNQINMYDRLIVPCEQNKIAFKNIGVEVPIHVVGLGVDEKYWEYKERNNTKTRFLLFANADWNNGRKNYPAALEAFQEALKVRNDIELVLKLTAGGAPSFLNNLPNIKVINSQYTKAELRNLVYSCDCLLSPTKGEGYGLPQREAMATGIPVIASGFAGLESIMSIDSNYSVDFSYEKPDYPSVSWILSSNNNSTDFGVWAKPSVQHITSRILEAAENKKLLKERGAACHEWIIKNETYEISVEKLLSIIRSKEP